MRLLTVTGNMPELIFENTAPWQWLGVVRPLDDPSQVRFVDVQGVAGNFFDAQLDPLTGLISVAPVARLDAEWFRAANIPTDLPITLRFFMNDQTVAQASLTFTVRVVDLDDTPPQALGFASGGQVQAGQAGAVIGRLRVTDPDTQSGFQFRLLEGDAWQFEVVGDELRLRPGIKLDLADGPRRDLIIEVSDGRQSSAFTLPIEILPDPTTSDRPIDVLIPGLRKAGFAWTSDSVGVRGFVPTWEVASLKSGGDMLQIVTRRGEEVWFSKPNWVDFGDGFVDYRPNGESARLWLAFDTVLDRRPTIPESRLMIFEMLKGATDSNVVDGLLTTHAEGRQLQALSNRDFVSELYTNIQGRPPSATVLNNQTTRLDFGLLTRQDLVLQLMEWRKRFDDYAEMVSDGFFVPRRHMVEIGTILQVGGDYPFLENAWTWSRMFEAGTWTLLEFTQAVLDTEPGRRKWGAVSHREFVEGVVLDVLGRPFEEIRPGAVDAWVSSIEAGRATRAELLRNVAAAVPGAVGEMSDMRWLPQGDAFQVVW